MTTLTSTVPGAIAALVTHLGNVATAQSALNLSTSVGLPIEEVHDNFVMIGDVEDGSLVSGYRQDWRGMPAYAERRSEQYGIPCAIRAFAGSSAPTARITDAFAIFDAVLAEIQSDPQASVNGGYPLTPSGSWQVTNMQIPMSGPLEGAGWGLYITFTVSVSNVELTS
jgi:hypothetical protein